MTTLRHLLLIPIVVLAFAAGFMTSRWLRPPRKQTPSPRATVPTPAGAQALAQTLAKAEALYQQGQLADSAAHYEAALRYMPEDASVRVKLARVLFADRDWFGAFEQLKTAIEMRPDCGAAYCEMAQLLASRGRGGYPKAFACAERAKELGYPVPDELWQKLEALRKANEQAKREGRPCPDSPLSGLDSGRVGPLLLKRAPQPTR